MALPAWAFQPLTRVSRGVMLRGMALRTLVVASMAVLVAGCGRALPLGATTTPTSAYQALVVGLPDPEGNAVTRRFDSTTGRTLATQAPTNASTTRFTAAGGVSYLLPDSIHSEDPAGGPSRTDASDRSRLIAGYAWSPAGALAYVAHSMALGSGSQLVIDTPAGARATVQLPPAVGRGGRPALRFSPDGRLLLLVDTVLAGTGPQPTVQIRRLDGSLLFGPAAAGLSAAPPSEAVWAGSGRLYFWDGRGVNLVDLASGVTRTVLPGVHWFDPDASPDGRTIVFERRDGRGRSQLALLDTQSGTVVGGFARDGAILPRFVSPSEIWFHEMGTTRVSPAIVSLDLGRLTEEPTGLTGYVTDVRQLTAR